jgi:hypothetical protein
MAWIEAGVSRTTVEFNLFAVTTTSLTVSSLGPAGDAAKTGIPVIMLAAATLTTNIGRLEHATSSDAALPGVATLD